MVRHDSDTLTNKDIASYTTSKWTQHYFNLQQLPKVGRLHGRGHSHGSFGADGVVTEAVNGRRQMVRHDSDTLTNKDIASYTTSKWTQYYCNLLQLPKVGRLHGRGHSHGSFGADGVGGEAVKTNGPL